MISSPLFIRRVHVSGRCVDILIEGNRIANIGVNLTPPNSSQIIDGEGMAAFPTFANLHTHAAMTLLRSWANDVPLQIWLNDWIWPKEKLLTEEFVYWGVRLACLEMIRSGTTAFADMYFFLPAAAQAVHDSGIRALLGDNIFGDAEAFLPEVAYREPEWQDDMVRYCLAPHSIYSVSETGLRRVAQFCQSNNLLCQMHLSETDQEVQDCLHRYGCRPYEYLEKIGVLQCLDHRLIGAHSLHLSLKEIELMAHYGVVATHNPNSNLKLGSGCQFPYSELCKKGILVTLGTDGCASSNNLDMLEAAKTMSLLQKGWRNNSTVMPATETLQVATKNGFQALGIDAGELATGRLADLMLVDLNHISMIPDTDTLSNLLYSAHSEVIDTVICNGRILMQHRKVADEVEIIDAVHKIAQRLQIEGQWR